MNANFAINELSIETERLVLRPFKQSDLHDFYEYASVEGVGERAGWKHHESIHETQEILNLFIKENKTFAIVFKENNKVIGSLGIEKYGMEDKLTEFNGYYTMCESSSSILRFCCCASVRCASCATYTKP